MCSFYVIDIVTLHCFQVVRLIAINRPGRSQVADQGYCRPAQVVRLIVINRD
jgi:predicted methyltransferase